MTARSHALGGSGRWAGACDAIRMNHHLPATPRSGQLGACFRGFALLVDGSRYACQLCYGRRDRDNY
jgi:hypothetical protein